MAHDNLVPRGDIKALLVLGEQMDRMARGANIQNVFDDNGYKTLFIVTLLGLKVMKRSGDDAVDSAGRTYEIKTVNRLRANGERKRDSELGVTTEHTMTLPNLARYRKVEAWVTAVFDGSKPERVYAISPRLLEPFFLYWEGLLTERDATGRLVRDHLNNRKIPWKFVVENGALLWPLAELRP